jgi:DNA invertase Pin-like site-specific DNA recombinase
MDKQVRVGVYARISDDRDGQQTATARQMEDCKSFAERKGWEVVDVFEDVDISAFSAKAKRPEFLRMLEVLRVGELDGVLVWKLDRLTRQQRDLVRVMEACEVHKAFIASVTEPINTADNIGQFVAELLVAQARMESANTSLRQRRKAKQQREEGAPPSSGKRCFGYDARYTTIIEEEAAHIRDARDRLLAGESLRGICFDWEGRGILTTGGRPWRTQFLRRLLTSPTLSAQRELDGTLYPGTWPAIISPQDTKRLQEFFARRSRSGPQARSALLTGFMRCAQCGGRMYASRRVDTVRRYVCLKTPGTPGCGKTSTKAEPVEELVTEMVFATVDGPELKASFESRGESEDGLFEALGRDEQSLEALAKDFYADHLLSREEFLAARTALNERLEANRMKLAKRSSRGALGPFVGNAGLLRETWKTASLEWRRSIIGALLERVEISPGRPGRLPFDAGRVEPIWR